MVHIRKSTLIEAESRPSRLSGRPWESIVILTAFFLISAVFTKIFFQWLSLVGLVINPISETIIGFIVGIIVFFGIVPYILGLPQGKVSLRRFSYTIGIRRPQSSLRLLVVFLPCIVILFSSWLLASFIYNYLVLGWDLTFFISKLLDTSRALPPQNWAIVTSIGSIFEEIVLRGIFITMLLNKNYSERESIGLSAVVFGVIHFMNLLNGSLTTVLLAGVLAQVIYATSYGLFYGYLFIKTRNLIPNMVLHYVGNGFISFWWYTPAASYPVRLILMLVFYIGLFPTILSITWVKYSMRWYERELKDI
ncbi:MAG: CPBP family intramembrane glutamic endopeptidase [Candidatus Hodarchaeales archaeon]|jgi:membrane protease YdiL (CAAX protease family)